MTPIAGFVIAMICGLIVKDARRATATVLAPWLVVLGYQSWYIASGRAISPPSTVTDLPSAIGYWVVQAIILAPALGIAAQLGRSRARQLGHHLDAASFTRSEWVATGLSTVAAVVIILFGFVLFRQEGGTVFVTHHSSGGSPPLVGKLGLLLSFATCAGLAAWTRIRRHRRPVEAPVTASISVPERSASSSRS